MQSAGRITGYLYDAENRRVAKGSLTMLSCDLTQNGFSLTESYLLGQGGEQLAAIDQSGNWIRANVFANGSLLGTYDANTDGFHYAFADWLGTKRVQYSLTAGVEEACSSLPYGDSQSCSGSDATTRSSFAICPAVSQALQLPTSMKIAFLSAAFASST